MQSARRAACTGNQTGRRVADGLGLQKRLSPPIPPDPLASSYKLNQNGTKVKRRCPCPFPLKPWICCEGGGVRAVVRQMTSHSGAGNPWFNLGLCRWPRRGLVRGMPSAANRYCWLRGGVAANLSWPLNAVDRDRCSSSYSVHVRGGCHQLALVLRAAQCRPGEYPRRFRPCRAISNRGCQMTSHTGAL